MTLISCITALSLSLVVIYPPLHLLNTVLYKQEVIEEEVLLRQNMNRALELISRAIRESGYRVSDPHENSPAIQINQAKSFRGSDAIELMQAVPTHLAYDCMGNVLSNERTRHQKTYQHFYLERNPKDPRSAILICQSLDRQGRLHQAELVNQVQQLSIHWLKLEAGSSQPMRSQARSGLIEIRLGVERNGPNAKEAKRIEETRWVALRHI